MIKEVTTIIERGNKKKKKIKKQQHLPLLIRCFSPDRIPGVSMMLMLSSTGFGIWAHINLREEDQTLQKDRHLEQSDVSPLGLVILQ